MNDFTPEIRNKAWWATDSRQAMSGKAVEIILQKQGKMDIPDLSEIEAVQMGHVMQPVIGKLVTSRLGLELKDADYALTHPKEQWLRSHFDFITADGSTLVEAKNYHSSKRNRFDPATCYVPVADYTQCLHEAVVHNVDKVILAVLFGGQEFHTFEFTFSAQEKEEFIKNMAVLWAYVKNNTVPDPETIEQTKLAFPQSNENFMIATANVENAVQQLKLLKQEIKDLEKTHDEWEVQIRNIMQEYGELRSYDGQILATWKNSKPSKRFSSELFKQSMPDIYEQFVIDLPGIRRFLIK